MKYVFKLIMTFVFVLSTQQFFAQDTTPQQEKALLKSMEEAQKAEQYQKKIAEEKQKFDAEKKRLDKEQKRIEKHERELKKTEKCIQKTQKKVDKEKAENDILVSQIANSTSSDQEIQKLKIKSTKQKLYIHKMQLKLLEEQKKFDELRASF